MIFSITKVKLVKNRKITDMAKFIKGQTGNPTGRPKGAKNKVSKGLREAMTDFLNSEFVKLEKDFPLLSPRDRMKFFTDLLPYVMPRLQTTSLAIDFEKMTDEQLSEIIVQLKTEAIK